MESVFAASPDLRFFVDELLDCAPGVVAMRIAWRGSSTETGGTLEVPLGYVATIVDDRLVRLELFEPDAETSIRACFADLRGRTLLGDRPPERWWADGRAVTAARSIGLAQHVVAEDTRAGRPPRARVGGACAGRDGVLELRRLRLAHVRRTCAAAIDEVLACDERMQRAALHVRRHQRPTAAADGDPGRLCECTFADRVCLRCEQFDHDDTERDARPASPSSAGTGPPRSATGRRSGCSPST